MKERLQLYPERLVGPQNFPKQLLRNLRESLGPARLLHLKTVGLHRQLGQALNGRHINKFPALQLSAIAEVGILGQGIVLPSAGIFDHRLAQNSRSAVKVEKQTATCAGYVLQNEMAIQEHGLDLCEHVVMAIQITPARLHHTDLLVGEEMHRALEKISRRNKIGIEDRHNLSVGRTQSILQCTCLEAVPVFPADVFDGKSCGLVVLDQATGERR